jgi:effector-binding domain-containing protein
MALFLVLGLLLPSSARVERSIVVQAPAATVYTVLNGYRQFPRWSPWAELDPEATTTLEGPALGVGAKMSWSGNDDVGTGSQEIIESTPYSSIRQKLAFGGFGGEFASTYELRPRDGGTEVRWAFIADYGDSLVGRYFGLLSDSMVGGDYERGLARLKALVESLPPADFSGLAFEAAQAPAGPAVMTLVRSPDEPTAVGVALGVAYARLSGHLSAQRLAQTAPPLAIYRAHEDGTLSIDAAIPVDRADAPAAAGVRVERLPGGPAVRAEYRGAYAGLAAARAQVLAFLAAAGLEAAGPLWEQYVSDPARTPEAELVTHIFAPIR